MCIHSENSHGKGYAWDGEEIDWGEWCVLIFGCAWSTTMLQEFELRKLARSEGRRYCNTSALTYQAERMPEQIRLIVRTEKCILSLNACLIIPLWYGFRLVVPLSNKLQFMRSLLALCLVSFLIPTRCALCGNTLFAYEYCYFFRRLVILAKLRYVMHRWGEG